MPAPSTLTACLLEPPAPEELALLRGALDPGVRLRLGAHGGRPSTVDVLVAGRPPQALLDACTRLRMVVVPWAGIPPATRELLLNRKHLALHALHHNDAPTAEHAMALLLAAARRIVPRDRELRAGDWSANTRGSGALLLDGRHALVLGHGHVGRRVARACHALGMRVTAVSRRASRTASRDGVRSAVLSALPRLLPRADALIVTLPLTPQTKGLVGAGELALLPHHALFVNVGRGPVVDEAALFHALSSGRLGAAGLDVWWRYPSAESGNTDTPPSAFPFGTLDNVVMSPHCGGDSDLTERRRMAALARLLNAAARGGRVPGRVDVAAGY